MDPNPYTKALNDWLISQLPTILATLTGILAVFLPWVGYQAQRWFKIAGDTALFTRKREAAKTAVLATEQNKQRYEDAPGSTQVLMKQAATDTLKALAPRVTEGEAPVLVEAAVREMNEKRAGTVEQAPTQGSG